MRIFDAVQRWWHRDELLAAQRQKQLQERVSRLFNADAIPGDAGASAQATPECHASVVVAKSQDQVALTWKRTPSRGR